MGLICEHLYERPLLLLILHHTHPRNWAPFSIRPMQQRQLVCSRARAQPGLLHLAACLLRQLLPLQPEAHAWAACLECERQEVQVLQCGAALDSSFHEQTNCSNLFWLEVSGAIPGREALVV